MAPGTVLWKSWQLHAVKFCDTIQPTVLLRNKQLMLTVLVALTCVCSVFAEPSEQRPDPLVIGALGRGTVPIGGLWQFKTGDNPAWASPDFDDSQWERLRVDRTYAAQGHRSYHGYAWYRRHVDFVSGNKGQKVVLIVFPIGGEDSWAKPYELYWNGVLIGREGKMPPEPDWPFRPPPNSFGLGEAQSGVLAVRTWTPPPRFTSGTQGGIYMPPLAGSPEAVIAELGRLDHEWLANRQFYLDENLLFGLLGILGLVGWLRDRSLNVLFWLAIYALMQPLHVMLFNAHLGLSGRFVFGSDMVVETLATVSLWYLLLYLLGLDELPQLKQWTLRIALIDLSVALLIWFVDSRDWSTSLVLTWQIADGVLFPLTTLLSMYTLVLIAYGFGKPVSTANWLVAASASLVTLIGAARIASLEGARFTHNLDVYHFIQRRIFSIRGNYFDAQNIAVTLLLLVIVYAVLSYTEEQSHRKAALEQDLKSAQELQRILIPESLPPLNGYTMTSSYHPADEVGGDFFQVIAQADGSTLVVLGDVSGKGLKAAMTVSLLVGTVRTLAEQSSDPTWILSGLNRRLEGRMQNGFATCLVLRLEPSGKCEIANAGHLPPFLNREEIKLTPALPIGIVPDGGYQNVVFEMAIGDRLTLYTDGLLEARNPARELFGFARVNDLMASVPDADAASKAAVAFGQEDDITVLTLTFAPGVVHA
jgi:serine phosphatase RsbU (regulator of sigma subunit)